MNISVPKTNAPVVWGANLGGDPPQYAGYSGTGVVVGVVDTGLDLSHADFKGPTGTRVLYMWDQSGIGKPPPSGYFYGALFSAADIDANNNISIDLYGTGTHLTGIAAGNGRATANGYSAHRYVGMAPNADLILVRCLQTDMGIIDGVNFIFTKAQSLGKPCVVLVTAVNQRGPHDGSAVLDRTLSALCGPGKLIVCPVGDDVYQQPIHAKMVLASGGSGTFNFTIPPYSPSTGETLEVQMWHDPASYFQVQMTSPNGITSSVIAPGVSTGVITTADGSYVIANDTTTATKNGVTLWKLIDFSVYWQGGSTARPAAGAWTISVTRVSPSTNGRIDAWIANWLFGSGGKSPYFTTNIDLSMTAASPSTGDNIVSVSAYTTRNTWVNFLGQISFYTDNPPLEDFYDPCWHGPRADYAAFSRVQCPDVCAPGEGVISALPINMANQVGNLKVDDGVHYILRKSAQAAAHVAGALALRLQQIPTLSPAQAKEYLHETALADIHTGAVPNDLWGSGKLFCNTSDPPIGVGGGKLVKKFVA